MICKFFWQGFKYVSEKTFEVKRVFIKKSTIFSFFSSDAHLYLRISPPPRIDKLPRRWAHQKGPTKPDKQRAYLKKFYVQHEKSATRQKVLWENIATRKLCYMKRIQLEKSATWREWNTMKVRHDKSVTRKKSNIKRVQHGKNATW